MSVWDALNDDTINGQIQPIAGAVRQVSVQISNGNTEADNYIDIGGYTKMGIIIPDTFEGTAITFKAASDINGADEEDIYDDEGNQTSLTVAADRAIGIDTQALDIAAFRFLKLVAGTSQSGNTTLIVTLKG